MFRPLTASAKHTVPFPGCVVDTDVDAPRCQRGISRIPNAPSAVSSLFQIDAAIF